MADMNTWAGFGLGRSPWLNDNAMNYWRQSPMAYAHQIQTPTLILSATGDERVTVSQSYKLYHALKDNGVEVKFVVYPVSEHFPPPLQLCCIFGHGLSHPGRRPRWASKLCHTPRHRFQARLIASFKRSLGARW